MRRNMLDVAIGAILALWAMSGTGFIPSEWQRQAHANSTTICDPTLYTCPANSGGCVLTVMGTTYKVCQSQSGRGCFVSPGCPGLIGTVVCFGIWNSC